LNISRSFPRNVWRRSDRDDDRGHGGLFRCTTIAAVRLICPVRHCGLPLSPEPGRFVCGNRHSFDVARSGYVNLLQPQDRRSKSPGDTAGAVAARRRFLDAGHAAPLVDAVVSAFDLPSGTSLVDAGCGEGHHLEAFRRAHSVEACGVDISLPAIDLAARRHGDRTLPFESASVDALATITARLNPTEFHRVLRDGGRLLVVLPAPDDLLELRQAVLGEGVQRDRVERTLESFAGAFTLEQRMQARHLATLDRQAIDDVMTSSYRGLRSRERERLQSIDGMEVTMARDILLLRKDD
jgi:23S rRNA (guanine745-N1)-methyltransferase